MHRDRMPIQGFHPFIAVNRIRKINDLLITQKVKVSEDGGKSWTYAQVNNKGEHQGAQARATRRYATLGTQIPAVPSPDNNGKQIEVTDHNLETQRILIKRRNPIDFIRTRRAQYANSMKLPR